MSTKDLTSFERFDSAIISRAEPDSAADPRGRAERHRPAGAACASSFLSRLLRGAIGGMALRWGSPFNFLPSVAAVLLLAAGSPPIQAQGSTTYYFPHLAVGDGWQTTITYINYSSEVVTCTTDFLSDQGTPLLVSFADRGTVVSRRDVLPPGESVHQETSVDLSTPLSPGWALASCTGPLKASLLFRRHNSEGEPVAEGGVNATRVPATRFVTFAEQGEGQDGTGVAYANPSATAALVTFTVKDAEGQVLARADRTLLAGGHDAQNMALLFGLISFSGSLEITSTVPIVSLSLNFEAGTAFSSLPPGEVDAAAQEPTTYYFPHLAVGAGWQTTITYINNSPQEVSCQTDFLSDRGSPLLVSFADVGMMTSRIDALPPGGSVHEETNVDLSAPLASGWARASCTGPLKASLLFRQHNSAGVAVAEGGVSAATVPATRFVTFAEQGEGKSGTGVAYANPSDTAALVIFTVRDAEGRVLASVNRPLLPRGHDAQNMASLFDLSSFSGSLEITSTEPIVSLSLNFEAGAVFSSLPPGEAPPVTTPSVSVSYPAGRGTIFIGEQVQFLATMQSSGGGPQAALDAVWESDAPAVATVSSSGLLTAVSAGEATISAEVIPGGRSSLRIRVFPKFHGHWEGNLNITRKTVPPAWREGAGEECEGLDDCSEWARMAADFTQDGQTVTGSVRTNYGNEPPDLEWTVHGEVSLDGTLSLTFDEVVVVPEPDLEIRLTVISWKSRADTPGVMTGTAAQQLSSDDLPGDVLNEVCLGPQSRRCSGWRSSDIPVMPPGEAPLAPASQAALDDLLVGKRMLLFADTFGLWDFISPGRFKAVEVGAGIYSYETTEPNTGTVTVTLTVDNLGSLPVCLIFDSRTTGRWFFSCDDESPASWRLVDIPAVDPGTPTAPADQAAFHDRVVGKRMLLNGDRPEDSYYIDFVSPGLANRTLIGSSTTNEPSGPNTIAESYSYEKTGSNTGMVFYNLVDRDDDVELFWGDCTDSITFDSRTTGWLSRVCGDDGFSVIWLWRLVDIPTVATRIAPASQAALESFVAGKNTVVEYLTGPPPPGKAYPVEFVYEFRDGGVTTGQRTAHPL